MDLAIVPSDFGEKNGTPIENKDTILLEINKALGRENPSIEYILVKPFANIKLPFGYGLNYNSYGHAAVRYKHPETDDDIVMNIEGKREGKFMVQFYEASDFFYGTKEGKIASQMGVYNRDMIGIRIEDVNIEDIKKMHEYFLDLMDQESKKVKKFNIIFGPVINTVGKFVSLPEHGNCAKWTSEGLKRAGVVTSISIWPKSILIDIYENYFRTSVKSQNNMNIVFYKRPESAKLAYGVNAPYPMEDVAPFQWIRSMMYSNMIKYSRIYVKVPENEYKAVIDVNDNHIKPNMIRNIVNDNRFILASVMMTVFLYKKGFSKFKSTMKNIYAKYKNI